MKNIFSVVPVLWLLACVLGAADPAPPRSAATIAAEKDAAEKALAAKTASTSGPAPGARPIPGEMNRATLNEGEEEPITLLGVRSARTGITKEYVQRRDEYWKAKEALQPQVDAQEKLKKQYDEERYKLGDRISELEKQRGKEIDGVTGGEYEEREARKKAIREKYETEIQAVRDQQDDLVRKKNEADEEIEKIGRDPKLLAAERELNNQIARETRKYFPNK